jgi:HSP20 family protein
MLPAQLRPISRRWKPWWVDDPWAISEWEALFSAPEQGHWDHITPPADIIEEEDRYVIKLDLPAADRNSIKVQMHDGTLSVFAERKESEFKGCYCRQERPFGHFGRSFHLGNIDVPYDKVDAHYEDGVLTITLPKGQRSQIHQIPIKTE